MDSTDGTWTFPDRDSGEYWFHLRAGDLAGRWTPTSDYAVRIDVDDPTAPTAVGSTSHAAGVPSHDDTVDMTWTAGSDLHAGVRCYSVAFTGDEQQPTDGTCDTTATSYSESLPPGEWYFHVRTVDWATNTSEDSTYGPIVIRGESDPLIDTPWIGSGAQSDELGVEPFFPMDSFDLGAQHTGYTNLRTGNLVVKTTDVTVPGHHMDVSVTRTFNSAAVDRLLADSSLGAGWTLAISTGNDGSGPTAANAPIEVTDIVEETVQGVENVVGKAFVYLDGDGTSHRFVRRGGPGSRWHAPPGVDLRLTSRLDTDGDVHEFSMWRPDGIHYHVEETNPSGVPAAAQWHVTEVRGHFSENRIELSYDTVGDPAQTRLVEVTHHRSGDPYRGSEDAPSLTLDYDVDAHLSGITALPGYQAPGADGSVRSWERTYSYGMDDDTGQLDTFYDNQGASNLQNSFYYYTANEQLYTLRNGGSAKAFSYDEDNRLRQRSLGEGNTWTYDYAQPPGDGPQTTTLSDPADPDIAHTVHDISGRNPISADNPAIAGGNVTRLELHDGTGGVDADEFSWDANRVVSHTDPTGAVRSFEHNDRGMITAVTSPPPNDAAASGLPAGAPVEPVTDRLDYHYAYPASYDDCPEDLPRTVEGTERPNCYLEARIATTEAADSHPAQRRITYNRWAEAFFGEIVLYKAIRRARRDGTTDADDRTTTFAYHDNYITAVLESIDGPRNDVADVTSYGDPGADPEQSDLGYDRTGQPNTVTDAAGNVIDYRYSPYGPVIAKTDRDGNTWTYRYSGRDNLIAATDPDGDTTTHDYDFNDNRVSTTTPSGDTTQFVYDGNDRLIKTDHPDAADGTDGGTTTRSYTADGHLKSVTTPEGHTTVHDYAANGRRVKTTEPAGSSGASAVTDWVYDGTGRPIRITGPATTVDGTRPVTVNTYSPAGTLIRQASTADTGGLDRVVDHAYNAHGERIRTTGPRTVDGVVEQTDYSYNVFGEKTAAIRRLAGGDTLVHRYEFDKAGNLAVSTRPAGPAGSGEGDDLTTHFDYDLLNRLVGRDDPAEAGHTVAFAYSPSGRQTARTDLLDGQAINRTTVGYNPDGTVRHQIAEDVQTGESVAACAHPAGDPDGGYDEDGNLLVLRHLKGTSDCTGGSLLAADDYGYDTRSRLVSATLTVTSPTTGSPISRSQSFEYDTDGNLVAATHDGDTVSYTPTPDGATDDLTDWRGVTSDFAWVAAGLRTQADLGLDGAGGSQVHADQARHPDGSVAQLSWSRDAGLFRHHGSIDYDVGGLKVSEHVTVVKSDGATYGDYAAGYGYDLAGRLTEYQSPFAYDPAEAGQPDAGRPVQAMTVDEAGNVTARDTVVDAVLREQQTATYTADRLDVQTVDFFDAAGTPTGTATIDVGYDRLGDETSRSSETAGGTVTDRTTATGPGRHVTDVDQSGGDDRDVDYRYTATGRLLARTETDPAAATTAADVHFNSAATGALAEIADGNGHTRAAYLSTPDGHQWGQQRWPEAADGSADETAAAQWVWLADDTRGNVATELATDGTVLAQAAYDPYGTDEASGSDGDPAALLGFQSSPTDEVTGATLVGPRQYDPQTGRFTTADHHTAATLDLSLATDPLTGNPYIYAGANPVRFHDDGHRVTEGTTQGSSPSPPRTAGRASPSDEFTIHGDPLFFHDCSPRSQMCGPGRYPKETVPFPDVATAALFAAADAGDKAALTLAALGAGSLLHPVTAPAAPVLGGGALVAGAGASVADAGAFVIGSVGGSTRQVRKDAFVRGATNLSLDFSLATLSGGVRVAEDLVDATGGRRSPYTEPLSEFFSSMFDVLVSENVRDD